MIMNRLTRNILFTAIMSMLVGATYAQRPKISGQFSKQEIEVGDQVEYIIDIEKDRATDIGVPRFKEEMSDEQAKELAEKRRNISTFTAYDEDIFEQIEEYPFDTISIDGRHLHLRKRYRLAVMETGDIYIRPSILYFEKNRELPDTIFATDSLVLHVARYEQLDTTSFLRLDPTAQQGAVVDSLMASQFLVNDGLRMQKDMPFIFDEIKDYVIYGIIALVILALVVWFIVEIYRHRANNRSPFAIKAAPQLPPHVVANKALVELSHRKLWQNGMFKPYYTTLASILRVYISGRWGIGAMEMTTDEIIRALGAVDMSRESRMDLVSVLRTADMVKFAKACPDGEQNEQNYWKAYYFVENTKPTDEERNDDKREITIETKIND